MTRFFLKDILTSKPQNALFFIQKPLIRNHISDKINTSHTSKPNQGHIMKTKKNHDLNLLIRPYTFVLQEGKTIKNNFMDYNLKLLLGKPEFIKTPHSKRDKHR